MTMTPEEAEAIAQAYLDHELPQADRVVFMAEDLGPAYAVHHTTRKFFETQDLADAPRPGIGSICVPKDGSPAWLLLSSLLPEDQIADKYGSA